jgi:2-dehydro-3-deoxygalactonokinase
LPKAGITLIASGRLAILYQHAFDALSVAVSPIDADEAVRRGLSMAAAAIWTK